MLIRQAGGMIWVGRALIRQALGNSMCYLKVSDLDILQKNGYVAANGYVAGNGYYINIYNIASPENNGYKICDPPCRRLAPLHGR